MNFRRVMCSPLTTASAYHTARGEAALCTTAICTQVNRVDSGRPVYVRLAPDSAEQPTSGAAVS
jgi:hypothetical protein